MCVTRPHKATLFGDTILEHWRGGKRRVVSRLKCSGTLFPFRCNMHKEPFCELTLFLFYAVFRTVLTRPFCPPPAGSLYLQPSLRSSSPHRSPSRSITSSSRRCPTSGAPFRLRPSWAPSKAAGAAARPRPRRRRARHPGSSTSFSLQGRTG